MHRDSGDDTPGTAAIVIVALAGIVLFLLGVRFLI